MGKTLTREEMAVSLKDKKVWMDQIDIYILGLSIPLEREIMRYIVSNQNCVDSHLLVINFVYQRGLCTRDQLSRRLKSLVEFGFLNKTDYKSTSFYEIKKSEA